MDKIGFTFFNSFDEEVYLYCELKWSRRQAAYGRYSKYVSKVKKLLQRIHKRGEPIKIKFTLIKDQS